MPTIEVDQQTYDRLSFGARMAHCTIGEVLARLLDEAVRGEAAPDASTGARAVLDDPVPVYGVYHRHRIEGTFLPLSGELKITTGPLAGKTYSSPSAAAIAVVDHFNPDRAYKNTNGRTFWVSKSSGKSLRSILGRR